MPKIYLRTPYGNQYHIHPNGDIQRLDQHPADKPFKASGQWKCIGFRHVKKAEFIRTEDVFRAGQIPEFLSEVNGSSLRYKNGNPQWTVVDLDHGTRREWGNTKAHGIADLRWIA